ASSVGLPVTTPATTTTPSLAVAGEVFATDKRPVVLYDGVCAFCNRWVDVLLRVDTDAKIRLSPLQSTVGQALLERSGRERTDISSVCLVTENECFTESDAVLKTSQALGGPLPLITNPGFVVPKPLRDSLYRLVADNRYSIAGKRECRCTDPEFADRFI
ncbi:unnamed protein product, partial [Chrysoparadoxa australica]